MSKRLALSLAALALLAVIGVLYAAVQGNGDPAQVNGENIIAFINGEPVEEEELSLFTRPGGGGELAPDGQESQSKNAFGSLLKAKVVQQEAVRNDLLKDSSYASFLKEWEEENRRRSKALQDGEVIYGPKEYTLQAYYDYRQSVMINALQRSWIQNHLKLSESALQDYYDNNRELLAKKHDRVTVYKIMEPTVERILELKTKLDQGASFMALYEEAKKVPGSTGVERIDQRNYREISKYQSGYYDVVMGMKQGDISDVVQGKQFYMIVMCAEREADGYLSFSEVREEVVNRYQAEAFETYMKSLTQTSEIQYTSRYEAFAMK